MEWSINVLMAVGVGCVCVSQNKDPIRQCVYFIFLGIYCIYCSAQRSKWHGIELFLFYYILCSL